MRNYDTNEHNDINEDTCIKATLYFWQWEDDRGVSSVHVAKILTDSRLLDVTTKAENFSSGTIEASKKVHC